MSLTKPKQANLGTLDSRRNGAHMNLIHPTAIIGDKVKLGSENIIGPYVIIIGNVTIGDNNWIGPYTTIGGPAEIRGAELPQFWETGYHKGTVIIGSQNVIREHCVIHAGFHTGTTVSNDCYIMNQTYIAHDCTISDQVTVSSQVALGGHVTIQQGVNLGMSAVVHQYQVVGSGCMVGMGSIVTKHIKPFSKSYGSPCRSHGVNVIGMKRAGLADELIQQVVMAFSQSDDEALRRLIANEMTRFDKAVEARNH